MITLVSVDVVFGIFPLTAKKLQMAVFVGTFDTVKFCSSDMRF